MSIIRQRIRLFSALGAFAAAGMLSACSDSPTSNRANTTPPSTTSAGNGHDAQFAVMRCTAQVAARTVVCADPNAGGANRDVIIGGQGQYVNLTSSNVAYSGGVFSFDATVQNLIPQTMNTSDGVTPDANGVRVFFASGPTVTAGTGNASVANADGVGTFTASNQPYFAYTGSMLGADQMLSTNEVTSAKTWQLNVDPTVTSFAFLVYVSTTVPHPHGFVSMSEDSNYVVTGQTHSISAAVRTLGGATVSGAPITWGTTDNTVATVDGSGTVTAVGPGTVVITATSDTLVGRTTLQICPDMSNVGSYSVVSGSGAGSVCLGGIGSGAAEFVAVPYNGSTSGSASVSFLATGIQAVTGPPTPDVIPAGARLTLAGFGAQNEQSGMSANDAMASAGAVPSLDAHMALQQEMRRGLPSLASVRRGNAVFADDHRRAVSASAASSEGVVAATGARTRLKWFVPNATTGVAANDAASRNLSPGRHPVVGDTMVIDGATACGGTPSMRTGIVRSVSTNGIIVADTANPAGGFTTAQFDSIGREFDSVSYAVDAANFGAPTDQDGNGGIVLFFTRAVNELSPPATSSFTYGYFDLKDLFARDPSIGCATSNEGEILYMMTPDPTGAVNSNVRTVSLVRGNTGPTLTHNLEHLINAWRRGYVVTGPTDFEVPWLDEGLADVALELAFYRMSAGLAPRQNIILSNLNTGPNASRRVAAYNTYENNNFSRLKMWLQRPDTTGAMLHTPLSDLTATGSWAARGVTWAFLRYASDRVNGTDASFWSSLVNSTLTGTANLQNAIGADPFAWARDFSTAMYTDDAVSGVPTQYTNPSWNFRSVYAGLGGFPLLTRPLTNNSTLTLSFNYGAASYLRLGVPTSGFARLTTTVGGSTPPTNFAMTIVRTK